MDPTVIADERQRRASASRQAHAARSGGNALRHPSTSEIEYSLAEMEFMGAIQEFKKRTGRQFPTLREVLAVVRSIGYSKPWDGSAPSPTTL